MENQKISTIPTVKNLLSNENVKAKFQDILKDRANGFTANLAVMVNNSAALSKCEPMTVISAAVVAASLDLPLDPNLGFAAIVPFGSQATFQIMYKGLIQLAMRSGQYRSINVCEIYEGELIGENRVTGEYHFDFTKKASDKIVGYAAYFRLANSFEKTEYWTVEKVEAHARRFSQPYRKGSGIWKEDFHSMARKTVLKSLLSKWGILSIEMEKAVHYDQAVVKNYKTGDVEYVDTIPQESPGEAEDPLKNINSVTGTI